MSTDGPAGVRTPDRLPYPAGLYDAPPFAGGAESFARVAPAHLDAFRRNGFLVVRHAYPAAVLRDALAGLSHLTAGGHPDYRGLQYEAGQGHADPEPSPEQRLDRIRKFWRFVDYEPRLRRLAEHPGLRRVLRRLLGAVPELFQDMALVKPPRLGGEKPWHQDHAYFNLPLATPVVGVWIALDPATVENGCMRVIPGSHREGPVTHFQRRDWQICDTDVPRDRAVAVPLEPGGCLFFHGLLHHGTPANRTDSRRRAVQFHFRPRGAREIPSEARLAVFGAAGTDVRC